MGSEYFMMSFLLERFGEIKRDLVIVHIDASKGFVDLWVHLTFAIFANFDLQKQLKWLSTKI